MKETSGEGKDGKNRTEYNRHVWHIIEVWEGDREKWNRNNTGNKQLQNIIWFFSFVVNVVHCVNYITFLMLKQHCVLRIDPTAVDQQHSSLFSPALSSCSSFPRSTHWSYHPSAVSQAGVPNLSTWASPSHYCLSDYLKTRGLGILCNE